MNLFKKDKDIVDIIYTKSISDAEYKEKIESGGMGESCENLISYQDEIMDEVLSEYFTLKKCEKAHIWYGEWENHRRMVVKATYETCARQIVFGYNYDFIPRLNRQDKFVYRRTDKAVELDVKDHFWNHIDYEKGSLSYSEYTNLRRKYELPDYSSDLDIGLKYIRDAVRTNIVFMQDFFKQYASDRDVLSFLDFLIEDKTAAAAPYYRWTKAFLYARLHEMDHAVETMQDYYEWRNGVIPQKVMEKLEAVKELT